MRTRRGTDVPDRRGQVRVGVAACSPTRACRFLLCKVNCVKYGTGPVCPECVPAPPCLSHGLSTGTVPLCARAGAPTVIGVLGVC